jgi:molybdate transport system ATP-binding protein
MESKPFITLDKISVRLRERLYLENTSWKINTDEHWAILGPNGAGKSTLVKSLIGAVPVVGGSMQFHFTETHCSSPAAASSKIGFVSSELHRSVFEREKLKDSFRDFSGDIEGMTTMKDMIFDGFCGDQVERQVFENQFNDVCRKLRVDELLARDIKSLSTGELSKALIVKALIRRPTLLILDEPFEGLDRPSRQFLSEWINQLMLSRMRVILVTHRLDEIVPNVTHVLFLKNGSIFDFGSRSDILTRGKVRAVYDLEDDGSRRQAALANRVADLARQSRLLNGRSNSEDMPVLIDMRNVNVSVGGNPALNGFNWVMRAGQNWALSGPAGAGKTTVLKLITGENLQAYANQIYLFGKQKGHGESIWEIRKRMGYISSELQNRHPQSQTALDIVCSGYFDAMGLYKRCRTEEIDNAKEWMDVVGIADLANNYFGRLSHGQKQLVLIARAMVKAPLLMILDEPCDGLDIANRKKIMDVLELIGGLSETDLIYVPNHDDEMLSCITHVLKIDAGQVIDCDSSLEQKEHD